MSHFFSLDDSKKTLYQWDTDQFIHLDEGITATVVHFANAGTAEALVVPVADGSAPVPNALLTTAGSITCYLIRNNGTVQKQHILVEPRKKPDDYVYTETETLNYTSLRADVLDRMRYRSWSAAPGTVYEKNDCVMLGYNLYIALQRTSEPVGTAGHWKQLATLLSQGATPSGITEETDPTVPAWAKEPTKPTYTGTEIGITDSGSYYTGATVEAALQEIGYELSGINTLLGSGVIS